MTVPGTWPRPTRANHIIPVAEAPAGSRPALVVFREKGSGAEGTVYRGQEVVRPCGNCGNANKTPL